ncbi:MAG: phenylalanine--tRNA ligase subunit beta [Planctomycetaceae bacterium]
MIVSWNWLKQYIDITEDVAVVADRLTMSGLNLEEYHDVGNDLAIDLEVTSNRADCLGHLGIAREVGALFGRPLKKPAAQPQDKGGAVNDLTSVAIECPEFCPRYIARVIKGVKIGPSPAWLVERLETVGLTSINNIVDITNYVLMECGQPLHAFDYDKLNEHRIVVRRAKPGEKIMAINQKEYSLDESMCVIADADRPVAIGGVMGGLATEIGSGTVNVLIEAAEFTPLSIRSTARKLNLHSDSSYRFERGVDPAGIDWASRRCCELIFEIAGGELCSGSISTGRTEQDAQQRQSIMLRFAQFKRVLGIEIPTDEVLHILKALGAVQQGPVADDRVEFLPPTWRRDLTREIDLIEEAARIYGYHHIPEDVDVPLTISARPLRDRVLERVRHVLTAAGAYEAVTLTFISADQAKLFTPRGEIPALSVDHSSRRHENVLRPTLIPSLLHCLRDNQRQGSHGVQLFETARVYLSADRRQPERVTEPFMLGFVSGKSFGEVKGILNAVVQSVHRAKTIDVRRSSIPQFADEKGAELLIDGQLWGWMGELSREAAESVDLKETVTVAEVDFSLLESLAELHPTYVPLATFPSISRDLNFILDPGVTWEQLSATVASAAGPFREAVAFGGQYRGPQIPAGKKSYVVNITYRAADRTLTSEEIDAAQGAVVSACTRQWGAVLRA